MVSKVNFCHRDHKLWSRRWIFAIDTTICGVEGEFLPSTPTEFLVSEEKFFKCPNISTGAEIVGVWKTKSYLEDFLNTQMLIEARRANGPATFTLPLPDKTGYCALFFRGGLGGVHKIS